MLLPGQAKLSIAALILIAGFSFYKLSSGLSFTDLAKSRESQAKAHYMMGLFYENKNNIDQAIDEYEDAVGLDSEIAALHLRLGTAYVRKGNFSRAVEELIESKRLDPESIEPGFMLAILYTLQNYPEKATKEYEEVLKKASVKDPKNIAILKSLAVIYYQQKKFEAAIESYKIVLGINSGDVEAIFMLGSLLEETGRRGQAIQKFKEALKVDPGYADALNSLGYLYALEGRHLGEAEKLIKQALTKNPENGAYADSLGWVYFKKNLIGKAIEQLEKAVSLLPDPIIYDHLGDAYSKIKRYDEAAVSWKKSLGLDPEQGTVKNKLEKIKPD